MSLQKQIEHSRRKKRPDESQLSNRSWSEGGQEVGKARDEVGKSSSQIETYQGTEQKQKRQPLNILDTQISSSPPCRGFWPFDTVTRQMCWPHSRSPGDALDRCSRVTWGVLRTIPGSWALHSQALLWGTVPHQTHNFPRVSGRSFRGNSNNSDVICPIVCRLGWRMNFSLLWLVSPKDSERHSGNGVCWEAQVDQCSHRHRAPRTAGTHRCQRERNKVLPAVSNRLWSLKCFKFVIQASRTRIGQISVVISHVVCGILLQQL